MTGFEFPETLEIGKAYRTAYGALAALVPTHAVTVEADSNLSAVLSQFPFLVDEAALATAAELGPPVSWRGPPQDRERELVMSGIDLDGGEYDFGDVQLDANAFEGPNRGWDGSALERAGMAYKRVCEWDVPPDEAGVWLVMLAPVSVGVGADGQRFHSGRLAGFVVVYDRDEDGAYESVGHIWTAGAWQRRGIARRLLTEARSRFPVTNVEGPYTDNGTAFLNACADPNSTVQS